MASIVFFAADHLRLLLEEVINVITGAPLPIKVADMRDDLENIQAFIYDDDRLGAAKEDKKRVKQLIEAAFRMEDAIDEYMICEERQPRDPGCAALCREPADCINTMILRREVKREYWDFKSRVREIKERSGRDGFQIQSSLEQGPSSSSSRGSQNVKLRDPRLASRYIEEAEVVGFRAPKYRLIDWLVNGRQERTVISVVGMGGLGKTTLAKIVFNSEEVKRHFDCRAWITVSQSYTVEGLLGNMLREFYRQSGRYPPWDIFQMDRGFLIDEVRNYLQQKRYVVVFDDVWNINFWDEIESAVIDSKNGSKIFITTRNMDVAVSCKRSSYVEVYELKPLTLEESLELFCMKAFPSDFKGNCPEDLQDISFEIVEKCNGLPLAIVLIGGALSVKAKNPFEWKGFSQNLSSELVKNSSLYVMTEILTLSYHDLPPFLKPCLLYFAIYPETYEVKSKRLIRQWIAEGFVKQEDGRTLEEVAEGYLTELIHRSLVQVSSVSNDDKVKGCRVPGLIREIIRSKAEDLSFCKFIGKDDWLVLSGIIRRLSTASTSNDLMASIESSHVRSLLFFTEEELPEYLVRRVPTKYKLLKVLDFESARSYDVPENLGDLIHLRYLSFRNTEVQSLPKSVGNLQNLETLDLRQTAVHEVPKEISMFRKLRHLLGNRMRLTHLKGGIGGMASLQTLSEVGIDEDGIDLIRELGKLKQLRKLSLFDVREEQGIALCSSIDKMQHLEKLYVETKYKDAAIDLSFVSRPAMLRKLRLQAKLNKLPDWIPKLRNLVELSLSHSQLAEDPLRSLERLPNLLVLNLALHSYEGECLHFHEGGFQNLKELGLRYLYRLNSIIVDEGALHSLKELTFMNIPNLKTAPSGILHLEQLEVLNSHFMPTEFDESIAPLTEHVKYNKLQKQKV